MMRLLASLIYRKEWGRLKRDAEKLILRLRRDSRFKNLHSVEKALVLAEDHRYFFHKGVDSRAMVRAIYVSFCGKPLQGGSTITQQLTRHLTNDYRRTIRRKFKELLLATMLDARFSKDDLIKAYLAIAYFGWRMNGVHEAVRRLGFVLPLSTPQAAAIVARLKYPEPARPGFKLAEKIEQRTAHIERLIRASDAK